MKLLLRWENDVGFCLFLVLFLIPTQLDVQSSIHNCTKVKISLVK